MRHYSSRYRQPAVPDVYWRRRALALATGIAVVALLAWAVNGMLSDPATTPAAAVKASGGQAGTPGGQAGAGSGGSPGKAAGHATASASASPSGSKSGGPPGGRSRRASDGQHGAAGSCRRGNLVLTLVTTQHRYRGGAWPAFKAYVVNTGSRPCGFNTGYRSLAVIIRSGPARVWDSGDCGQGRASHPKRLARGVPVVRRLSWNRRTSFPGCHPKGSPARPGHYSATLVGGHVTSKPVRFVLRGSAAAQP
ncbi:MAG: hypothetical protein LBI49_20755 [Nocardiopsaceae bacterium]|jgi:hypothetical protein|nr:hypothetical protein [Nocardiopsaceae bacterium]